MLEGEWLSRTWKTTGQKLNEHTERFQLISLQSNS